MLAFYLYLWQISQHSSSDAALWQEFSEVPAPFNASAVSIKVLVGSTLASTSFIVVRNQFISGTHALTVTLFGLLRPGDTLLSITGEPYDTLHEVIGIKENNSSLKAFGVNYEQIELVNNDFDYEKIQETLKNNKIKLIEIQRSKGYSTRKTISIEKLERVIKKIREVNTNVIIMVDNCYCEFVTEKRAYRSRGRYCSWLFD